jgi:hypothetical protein
MFFNQIRAKLGDRLLVISDPVLSIHAAVKIIKIKCSSSGADHPHHNGLALCIRFEDATTLLYPGDCTYEYISNVFTSQGWNWGFDYLAACHHGGNYHLSPARQDGFFIPMAQGAHNPNLFVSANGKTYGHPNQQVLDDHGLMGWNNVLKLHECVDPLINGWQIHG